MIADNKIPTQCESAQRKRGQGWGLVLIAGLKVVSQKSLRITSGQVNPRPGLAKVQLVLQTPWDWSGLFWGERAVVLGLRKMNWAGYWYCGHWLNIIGATRAENSPTVTWVEAHWIHSALPCTQALSKGVYNAPRMEAQVCSYYICHVN